MGKYTALLIVQIVLTVVGTVLAGYHFVETIGSGPTFLGCLFAVVYLASFLVLIVYACKSYRRDGNLPFRIVIYAYAALLGIQILQNGQFMASLGLGEGLTLFVNAANLIAFANVVKFSDKLDDRKVAIAYLVVAVVLKLAAELVLIILFIEYVTAMQVLMSLSVPLLGGTILVAYVSRWERLREAR